jgi:hypothetical protein
LRIVHPKTHGMRRKETMSRENTTMCYVVAAIFALAVARATATVVYVDSGASGESNGVCWADAYTSLQEALAQARGAYEPVEVRVAQGVYKPDRGTGIASGDIEAAFLLASDTTLVGGYAGVSASDPNARDTELYQTVLSGDLAGNDLPLDWPPADVYESRWDDPSRKDNSFGVVTITPSGGESFAVLDGFTITGAHSHDSGVYMVRRVGGLYVETGASCIVKNCTFTLNTAPGIGSRGSEVTVVDCTFRSNVARASGGGMWISGDSPRVIRCLFDGNWARNGGGLYTTSAPVQLEDCAFTGNVACGQTCFEIGFGGGLCCEHGASAVVKACSFADNIGSAGGAAYFGNTTQFPGRVPQRQGQMQIVGCGFFGNQAREGGALNMNLSTVDIDGSVLCGNSALWEGGAIFNLSSASRLSNCLLSGNRVIPGYRPTEMGAAVMAYGRRIDWGGEDLWLPFDILLDNCTLVGNVSKVGPGVSCRSTGTESRDTVTLSNCILDNGGQEIDNSGGSQVCVVFTDICGGTTTVNDPRNAVVWGEDNVDVVPLFALRGYWDLNGTADDPNDDFWVEGDYHLKSQAGRWDPTSESWVVDEVTSPCIDAGDPNSPIGLEPFPNGGRINMGAYGGTIEASKSYFGGPPCETIMAGDINGDCKVDITDLMILVNHWHEDAIQP